MPSNNIAFARNYTSVIDEVYQRASVSGVLNSGRRMVRAGHNAKEILIPKISATGLGDYTRNVGYKTGAITYEFETKTFNYDRGIRLFADVMDVEEAGVNDCFVEAGAELQRTQVAPEADAFTFAQIAGHTGVTVEPESYVSADAEDILEDLRTVTSAMDENQVTLGSRILFITPTLKGVLDDFSYANPNRSNRVLERFSRIVEVPQVRFYTASTCSPATTTSSATRSAPLSTSSLRTPTDMADMADMATLFWTGLRKDQARLPEPCRRHVAERRARPVVVVPVHPVEEPRPRPVLRRERPPAHQLALEHPVRRLDNRVVAGVAGARGRPLDSEGREQRVDIPVAELRPPVAVEGLDGGERERHVREGGLDQPRVLAPPARAADCLAVAEVDEQAHAAPRAAGAHVGEVGRDAGARRAAVEGPRRDALRRRRLDGAAAASRARPECALERPLSPMVRHVPRPEAVMPAL